MRTATCLLVAVLASGGLAGCAQGPLKDVSRLFERKGETQLKSGIKNYEDGRLTQASRDFESALSAGLGDADRVTAHKYLAFIHCVSKRERQCRGHFRAALDINPNFELERAEAGHPMWGPVFRSVKAGR
ncbi:MAG TPA: TssQ family T6SS-associated lipoprotein [Burkholderiales bacterium]|nr:TssQ family T6SS-associated lipoprotein [Burkholderiales bacterium]